MLPKESALAFYQSIVANETSGNYEQKVLGLRRIFNGVLLKMFPNISEQAFYCACIDNIFEVKKKRGEFRSSFYKKQREYHQLRLYFNNIMHSKIEADEGGYLTATRSLSSLINFCSQIDIPVEVSTIFTHPDINSTSKNLSKRKINSAIDVEKSKTDSTTVLSPPPTLCLIVDRRNDLSKAQLLEIENGIKAVIKDALKANLNFVVFTIKNDSSILAFPLSEKKIRFSFNGYSEDEQIKPLRDYLVNLRPAVQYHFFLTNASEEKKFHIPVALNESSFLMRIGIVENRMDNDLSDTRKWSSFDKLILESNLPSFFDWIIRIINNE